MKTKPRIALAALLFTTLFGSAYADAPKGWFVTGNAPTDYVFGTDTKIAHAGGKSAYIRAGKNAGAGNASVSFASLAQVISPAAYRGKRIRLSGYLRSEDAAKAQMMMRIDGPGKHVTGFDNMESRPVRGNTDWKRYDIVLDVPDDTVDIFFGFLLVGNGEVWADDFTLESVGHEVPVTGNTPPPLSPVPVNMGFED